MLWLHQQGYNYYNIPRLTYQEINGLIDAKKREVKKQEDAQKKAERKSKAGSRFRGR